MCLDQLTRGNLSKKAFTLEWKSHINATHFLWKGVQNNRWIEGTIAFPRKSQRNKFSVVSIKQTTRKRQKTNNEPHTEAKSYRKDIWFFSRLTSLLVKISYFKLKPFLFLSHGFENESRPNPIIGKKTKSDSAWRWNSWRIKLPGFQIKIFHVFLLLSCLLFFDNCEEFIRENT